MCMCMSPQARDRWWYIVPISICVVLLHSDFSIFVHLLLDNVTYASCNVWCPTCSWLARNTSSLLVETKELCYTYFGNLVSLYRQTSSDFHEVLLATIVNKYSLLDVVWIYQPSWEAQAAMNTEKETASRTHQHSKDKSNTLLVLRAYQTIHTFWYSFCTLRKLVYFGYGHTDDVNWYKHSTSTGMSVP